MPTLPPNRRTAPVLRPLCLLAFAAAASLVAPAQATVVFSLSNNGQSLVRFDSSAPGAVFNIGQIGGDTVHLDGLDFRPADGLLYGYNGSDSGIYRLDTSTGSTTRVSTSSSPVTVPLGIDFNPVADRLRVVTPNQENSRVNIATGAATKDGALAYGAADINQGKTAHIIDAAYTNNDTNPATGTQLYYIDSVLDTLVTTSNPNGGVLSTVGALGLDVNDYTGFDILTTANGSNIGYASINSGRSTGLYSINLSSGAASFIGDIGASNLYGLAVMPSAVPEPSSLMLIGTAGLALLGLRRRRQRGGAQG